MLRLGKRIGALLLDRVLRGEHEERLGQVIGRAASGHVVFLHRLEQGGLGLGRRPVDFVRQDHVREQRTGQEDELPPAGLRIVLENVGSGDVGGHQVGGELDPLETQVHDPRDGADQQRFRQARHADQQAMAPAQQGDDHFLDHLMLADDHLADLLGHAFVGGRDFLDGLGVGVRHFRSPIIFRNGTDSTGMTNVRPVVVDCRCADVRLTLLRRRPKDAFWMSA